MNNVELRAWIGQRIQSRGWVYPSVIGILTLVLYWPVLVRLVQHWWSDPDFGHGFLVPLFSAYVLWIERERWLKVVRKPAWVGLLVIAGAVLALIVGTLAAELFVARASLIVLLAGLVLYHAGWNLLRAVSFPLGFLVLMIPIPAILYNQVTFPLQLFASRFASTCLSGVGVPVLREGNLIVLPNYTLEIVEACSGIRSLMSLVTLALAYGYLIEKRTWVRVLLVLLMVPIAVVSNGFRVMGTGILTYRFGPQSAEGFFHAFSGWLIFVTAMLLMLAFHWLVNRVCRLWEGENA